MTTRRYTFSGVTEPDCTVTVGDVNQASVAADGAWTLDLMLGPGRNSMTFVAADSETGLETSQAIRVYYADLDALVLRGDGLGVVSFGDPVEKVMATLIDMFGPPSYDRLEESPFEPEGWTGPDRGPSACHFATVPIFGGYGCFDYIRLTSWSDVGLTVVFSDLMVNPWAKAIDDDYVEVPPGLAGYVYGAGEAVPSARTVQGIAVGSTVRELLTLGEAVTFGFGCGDDVEFSIDDPDSANGGVIHGSLFGTDGQAFMESEYVDPEATIRWFIAGVSRSC